MAAALVTGCLGLYRVYLSPLHPPTCRFYPSCSAYSLGAFRNFGFWTAVRLTVLRLLRCHPFHPGGYDPIPEPPSRRADCLQVLPETRKSK